MGATDEEQLQFATANDRVLCTFNTRDYVVLHTQNLHRAGTHAGIIVSDQVSVGLMAKRLLRLAASLSKQEMRNRLEYLSAWR